MRKSMVQRTQTRAGFTMIELMVVLAVIGILVMGMFRLMGVTSGKAKYSETVATLERVKNALSGYYAIYGSYPPVKTIYAPLDPEATDFAEYWDYKASEEVKDQDNKEIPNAKFANFAARAQPVSFEYPNLKEEESYINLSQSPSVAMTTRSPNKTETDWQKNKLFKFGLMSYLLPRVELMVSRNESTGQVEWNNQDSKAVPFGFFETQQWASENNPAPKQGSSNQDKIGILEKQLIAENDAAAKWLPNFEKRLLVAVNHLVMGVELKRSDSDGSSYASYTSVGGGAVLMRATIRDGWGRELYYYSEPPYQSYRLWSSGPDGATFPPWLDTNQYRNGKFSKCREWMADDVVMFDR